MNPTVEHLENAKELLLACGVKPYDTVELKDFFSSIGVELHFVALDTYSFKGVILNHYSILEFLDLPVNALAIDYTVFMLPSYAPDVRYLCCASIEIEEFKIKLHNKMTLGAFL